MSRPYTAREMEQQDRAAERREHFADWAATKPTKQLGEPAPIHPVFLDIFHALGLPQRQPETQE